MTAPERTESAYRYALSRRAEENPADSGAAYCCQPADGGAADGDIETDAGVHASSDAIIMLKKSVATEFEVGRIDVRLVSRQPHIVAVSLP
jgi:hypothetical protein